MMNFRKTDALIDHIPQSALWEVLLWHSWMLPKIGLASDLERLTAFSKMDLTMADQGIYHRRTFIIQRPGC